MNTSKPITITGRDIIELDNLDHTGALKELGVSFTGGGPYLDSTICAMTFQVDLDFVIRHGLIDDRISREHYEGSPEYMRYYEEGKQAYLNGAEEDPPYGDLTVEDEGYWNTSLHHQCYPWYDGYRETRAADMEARYHIKAFQDEVQALITKYGLTLKYTDEYGDPYAVTPEGYAVKLA